MKFQISSTWTRLQLRLRNTRSWYQEAAFPASITSLITVFLLAPVRRVVARIEEPSQSKWRTRARSSLVSLFILIIMREKSGKFTPSYQNDMASHGLALFSNSQPFSGG